MHSESIPDTSTICGDLTLATFFRDLASLQTMISEFDFQYHLSEPHYLTSLRTKDCTLLSSIYEELTFEHPGAPGNSSFSSRHATLNIDASHHHTSSPKISIKVIAYSLRSETTFCSRMRLIIDPSRWSERYQQKSLFSLTDKYTITFRDISQAWYAYMDKSF